MKTMILNVPDTFKLGKLVSALAEIAAEDGCKLVSDDGRIFQVAPYYVPLAVIAERTAAKTVIPFRRRHSEPHAA